MKIRYHVASSVGVGIILYIIYQKIIVFLLSFAGAVLIDLDHIFDVYVLKRRIFTVKEFLQVCYNSELKKIFLFLHSFEICILLIILTVNSNYSLWITSFSAGFIIHMILDTAAMNISWYSYFLVYRIYHKFDADKFYLKK